MKEQSKTSEKELNKKEKQSTSCKVKSTRHKYAQ